MGATRLSCMIMFILGGAAFLSAVHGFYGHSARACRMGHGDQPEPVYVHRDPGLIYLLLGAALDGISMIVLTTSIVVPMIQKAGFDLVWFGIFIVLLVEIAEVTPPVGFNLFVLQTMTGSDSIYVARPHYRSSS